MSHHSQNHKVFIKLEIKFTILGVVKLLVGLFDSRKSNEITLILDR